MTWQLAEAKNKLSEVVNLALTEGPQTITRRNDTVVLLSAKEYNRLTGKTPDFLQFLLSRPGEATLDGVDLTRDKSAPREFEL